MTSRTKCCLGIIAVILLCVGGLHLYVMLEVPRSADARCVLWLQIIVAAKERWALDEHKNSNEVPTWEELNPYLPNNGRNVRCPLGGNYRIGRVDELPTCSIGRPGHRVFR